MMSEVTFEREFGFYQEQYKKYFDLFDLNRLIADEQSILAI